MLITNLAEIIERPYFKAMIQFFGIDLNIRSLCCQVCVAMNNTHPRTQASSWSIENSPFRARAVLRLMFHLWRKTPCFCGGVYSVLIQTGLPHETPLRIYAGRNVYGYFFLHCSFIWIPGRVLAFHQHHFLNSSLFPSSSAVRIGGAVRALKAGWSSGRRYNCKYGKLTNVVLL